MTATPETTEAMLARVRDSIADGADRPFAVMQATMTPLHDRPGISG